MQCALGISQLSKVDRFKARRKEIVAAYNRAFQNIPSVEVPYQAPGLDSCFHLYVLQIDFAALGRSRTQVMGSLEKQGVGSQVHYIPVHTQPWYRNTYGFGPGSCPVAEAYYEKALSLPLYPKMSDAEVGTVIGALRIALT